MPASIGEPYRLPRTMQKKIRAAIHSLSEADIRQIRDQDFGWSDLTVIDKRTRGLFGYAWSVTGALRLLPLTSKAGHQLIYELGETFAPEDPDQFVLEWVKTPTWNGLKVISDST